MREASGLPARQARRMPTRALWAHTSARSCCGLFLIAIEVAASSKCDARNEVQKSGGSTFASAAAVMGLRKS